MLLQNLIKITQKLQKRFKFKKWLNFHLEKSNLIVVFFDHANGNCDKNTQNSSIHAIFSMCTRGSYKDHEE